MLMGPIGPPLPTRYPIAIAPAYGNRCDVLNVETAEPGSSANVHREKEEMMPRRVPCDPNHLAYDQGTAEPGVGTIGTTYGYLTDSHKLIDTNHCIPPS